MSNKSSKYKFVLYNPVTVKFWASRNRQFRKIQGNEIYPESKISKIDKFIFI